jgi:hypothetical protein
MSDLKAKSVRCFLYKMVNIYNSVHFQYPFLKFSSQTQFRHFAIVLY